VESAGMRFLLDTHAVLWAADGDARLGVLALAALNSCQAGEALISGITLLEISMLAQKGRVRMAVPVQQYLRRLQTRFPILGINADIAALAMDLKLAQGDPFDRIIVATALFHDIPLMTRDAGIRESECVKTVW
jgi:PIN domain nuclease of toxin-antitoxin system